jgi:hypothetical protein
MEDLVSIALNLLAAPFGIPAMYYGYKGYRVTRGGLRAYKYFFVAMTSVGAVLFFDLLFRIMSDYTYTGLEFLVEFAFLVAAIFFMLAFKDMYEFLRSVF